MFILYTVHNFGEYYFYTVKKLFHMTGHSRNDHLRMIFINSVFLGIGVLGMVFLGIGVLGMIFQGIGVLGMVFL